MNASFDGSLVVGWLMLDSEFRTLLSHASPVSQWLLAWCRWFAFDWAVWFGKFWFALLIRVVDCALNSHSKTSWKVVLVGVNSHTNFWRENSKRRGRFGESLLLLTAKCHSKITYTPRVIINTFVHISFDFQTQIYSYNNGQISQLWVGLGRSLHRFEFLQECSIWVREISPRIGESSITTALPHTEATATNQQQQQNNLLHFSIQSNQ